MKKLNYLYVIIPILIIIENFGYYIEMNIIIDPYSIYFLNIFDDLLYRGILGPFAEENIFRGGVLILLLIFFYFMISIGIIILIFIKFSNYMSDGEKIRFLLFKLKYMLNIEINKYLGGIGKEDFRKNILNQLLIIPIFLSLNWYFA